MQRRRESFVTPQNNTRNASGKLHGDGYGEFRRGPSQHGIGACRTVTGRSIRIRILGDTHVVDEVICFQRSVNSFKL